MKIISHWVLIAWWMSGWITASEVPAVSPGVSPYAQWSRGPATNANFFPLAVWLQNPSRAARYRAAGFNTYVALWNGPTEAQLAALKDAGMKLICDLNQVGRKHLEDPAIIGWMHGDEPDNAQSLGSNKGYGPPIPPANILADYEKIKATDPSRPVMLNLGQGVAWDDYYGRGVRTRHPEDYPEYMRGGDIVSFDIYPVVHDKPAVAGKLWYVPLGVDRLKQWSDGKKVVWNCIECTRIQNPKAKATPHQVRAEVWMSLIHGSQGLIYFVHEWTPKFAEAALLEDPEMLAAVTAINHQIAELAPVLNCPTIPTGAQVQTRNAEAPVDIMLKRTADAAYLFAVGMRDRETTATFTVDGVNGTSPIEVLGENRTLTATNGVFEDAFKPWDVHLYRMR